MSPSRALEPALKKAVAHPRWLLRKGYLWGRSLASLRKSDVIGAFFPKTGSTWVRIVLYHLYKRSQQDQEFSFDQLDEAMPEFANPSIFNAWPFTDQPRLIKTHRSYLPIFSRFRSVVFAREPRDTMVSFLHYANASKDIAFSGDLNDLVRHPEFGLDYYFRFYQSWLPRAGLIMKYEDMRADPAQHFHRLARFIGLEADEADVQSALAASTLERTRSAQKRSSQDFQKKFGKDFAFARKGLIGEGRAGFDNALEDYLQERRENYKFGLYPP